MSPKRETSVLEETEEEKKARKRQKKDAKKRKRESLSSERPTLSATGNSELTQSGGKRQQTQQQQHEKGILTCRKIHLSASILPSGLGDVKASVDRCIREFLLKYNERIEGILLAYKNVHISKDGRGRIVEELPHIHYDVSCDAIVFAPVLKGQLKGRVTESFHSHISLVVFNYFNASISAAHLRAAGFEYNSEKDMWYEKKTEYVVEKASYIRFAIENVHEAGKYWFFGWVEPYIISLNRQKAFLTLVLWARYTAGIISIDGNSPSMES